MAGYLTKLCELFASETLRNPITIDEAADTVCGIHHIFRIQGLSLRAIRAAR
jgi:hypothetical protein